MDLYTISCQDPISLVWEIIREYNEELVEQLEITSDDAPFFYLEDRTGMEYKITFYENHYELAYDKDRTECGDWYILYEGNNYVELCD